ncbi:MAG: sulfurtransferase [Rubrivivax sp.]|nr:sulfurtransferase [Rubrivivax sp.]
MSQAVLISPEQLKQLQAGAEPFVLLDCGFDLFDPTVGEAAYRVAHLPGALYAHLDRDLSGPKTGRNGRHPLPDPAEFAITAGRWGIAPGVQVVAYDAQGGLFAARAWWLLRWLGHRDVRLLDGGVAAWCAGGGTMTDVPGQARARPPYPCTQPAMPTIDADTLLARLGQVTLFDARAAERFRGEVEPIDPVAGRIPGARLRFVKDNLRPDGRLKPAAQLREEFTALGAAGGQIVHQCGSGAASCFNLMAMMHAGFDAPTLYPGSWSEWCSDPARPIARG